MARAAGALALAAPASAQPPRASLPDVEDEVMCVECGTVLSVSSSPVAQQERAFIREQIAAGKDKEQIKAALVDEYGEDVLAEPARSGLFGPWERPIEIDLPPAVNPARHRAWGIDSFLFFPNFMVLVWQPNWYLTYHYWPTSYNTHIFEGTLYFVPRRTRANVCSRSSRR